MRIHRYTPAPPLNTFIDCLWQVQSDGIPNPRQRALPTGTVEIVIDLHDQPNRVYADDGDTVGQRCSMATVCGPQSRYFVIGASAGGAVVGVHFRPGGAAPFFAQPLDELTDTHLDLSVLWGAAATQLCASLIDATTVESRFTILEAALRARWARSSGSDRLTDHALRIIDAAPELARVDRLRHEVQLDAKHFIARFRAAVGLAPKTYCRIRRFQSAIESVARGGRIEWAQVAAHGGFCDQSHLNREFRRFAGVTPGDYRPIMPDRPHHTLVDAAP